MTDERRRKVAGACGIAFVILFAAAVVLMVKDSPSGDTFPDKDVVSYFKDHKDAIGAATLLMALAGLCFLVFLGGLRERLEGTAREGRSLVPIAAGVLYVGLLFAAAAILGGMSGALDYQKPFTVDPNTGRLLLALGFYAGFYASIPAAVFVAGSSAIAARSGALPVWLIRAGYGVAGLCIVGLVAFPIGGALAALWTVPVSILLIRGAPAHQRAGNPTAVAPAGA